MVAIALVVGGFILLRLARWLRLRSAGRQLASAVVEQVKRAPEPVSAEAVKLREQFEAAVAALVGGRNRHSLYELPWYAFIGAPGSGKTTALVNSGLSFPLEQRSGRAKVRGVGGTRNCDWWFTDDAVFLDTAGRYTTQDSDPTSDTEGWKEFLALLSKFRPRRPLNGIILTISVQDLLAQGEAGRGIPRRSRTPPPDGVHAAVARATAGLCRRGEVRHGPGLCRVLRRSLAGATRPGVGRYVLV